MRVSKKIEILTQVLSTVKVSDHFDRETLLRF